MQLDGVGVPHAASANHRCRDQRVRAPRAEPLQALEELGVFKPYPDSRVVGDAGRRRMRAR